MLRYTKDRARPGLVALYDIQPGNGVGQFLQPRSPHGVIRRPEGRNYKGNGWKLRKLTESFRVYFHDVVIYFRSGR